MHAPPPPAYLLRLLLTTATFRRQGITTRRGVARLAALRYGGESASVPGCLCDGTGTLYRLFSGMNITPLQFACSGKTPVLRAVPLSMSIELGKK